MSTAEISTPAQNDRRKLEKRLQRKKIEEILGYFKFNQLITDVILSLFDLEPAELAQKLNELKMTPNKKDTVTLLSNRCQAFSVQELEEVYHSLQLYRTVFFSRQKKWVPINLLEPAEDLQCPTDERIIRLNLLQALRIKGLNAVVKVITYEELIWVMIIEKKLVRRRGIRLLAPIFICYEVGTPYIFVASKISMTIMECILRAMQYGKHKIQQLEGKDVKSLMNLLKHKAMNTSNSVVPFKPAQATVGHRFIDASKKRARESYVNKVFETKEPVLLETFHVHADGEWRDSRLVPEMLGEPFKVSMTLKSKDLVGMIKDMVAADMITTPLPDYMQTILRSAKNKVHMTVRHNAST